MASELARTPRSAESEKHAHIGGRVSGERIQERSVPVKENHARVIRRSFHRLESYQELRTPKRKRRRFGSLIENDKAQRAMRA